MLLCACKASISDAPPDGRNPDGMGQGSDATDAPPDGTMPLGPWGAPQKIPQMSTTAAEDDLTLSSNLLEMVFAIAQTNGKDLYYSSRNTTSDPWTTPVPVSFNTTTFSEETPRFSADDATLYFASSRASGNGTLDIFQVSHTPGSNTWGSPSQVAGVNTTVTEKWFMPCGTQGRYMLVRTNGANGTDFYEGTLGGAAATLVPALNSPQSEISTFLTQDCLTIYFASARVTPEAIFTSHRNDLASPWSTPTPVTDFMIPGGNGNQEDPYLAADNRSFFFASDAAGTKDLYVSTR